MVYKVYTVTYMLLNAYGGEFYLNNMVIIIIIIIITNVKCVICSLDIFVSDIDVGQLPNKCRREETASRISISAAERHRGRVKES
jgi:hypothetical protein